MRVLLFKGKGFISRLIAWQTRGKYSHAAIAVNDAPPWDIVESWQGEGVRRKHLENADNVDPFEFHYTQEQEMMIYSFLLSQLGKKYDYRGVIRFITRRRARRDDRWFCSELVYTALEKAGIRLFYRIEPWAVSPQMLSHSTLLFRR